MSIFQVGIIRCPLLLGLRGHGNRRRQSSAAIIGGPPAANGGLALIGKPPQGRMRGF
jgi:hypothetical protein